MASISGSSSITIDSLPVTYMANGFSDPDSIEWDVSGSEVGTWSSDGNKLTIEDMDNDSYTFTITASQGGITASKTVTVKEYVNPVTSYSPSSTSASTYVGSSTSVSYSWSPSGATTGKVPSLDSTPSYCSVSVGTGTIRITGRSVGSETITLSNAYGASISISVTIKSAGSSTTEVTGLSFSPTSVSMYEGETATLRVTVTPSSATKKTVTVSDLSENNSNYTKGCVSISSQTISGNVTTLKLKGNSIGKTSLLVVADGGSGVFGYVSVSVTEAPVYVSSITVSGSEYMTVGIKDSYEATVLPSDADDTSVSWSITQGSDIASIYKTYSDYVVIEPTGAGIVVIRASANDGSGTYGTFTAKVIEGDIPVQSIQIHTQAGMADETRITSLDTNVNKAPFVYVYALPYSAANRMVAASIEEGEDVVSVTDVNAQGDDFTIRGLKEGTAVVRFSATDESGVYEDLTVNVGERLNDDYPYDYYLSLSFYANKALDGGKQVCSKVGPLGRVHGGYRSTSIPGLILNTSSPQNEFTTIPAYDDAPDLDGDSLYNAYLTGTPTEPGVYWVYATDINGKTQKTEIHVFAYGDYTKVIQFDINAPDGAKVEGTPPSTLVMDNTGDSWTFEIPDCDLTSDSHVFIGWRTVEDGIGDGKVYGQDQLAKFTVEGENAEVTLYGEWFPRPEGSTGEGSLSDPFLLDYPVGAEIEQTMPDKEDHPISYTSFTNSGLDGMVFDLGGTEYDVLPYFSSVDMTSGRMTVRGTPVTEGQSVKIQQQGERRYAINYVFTIVDGGATHTVTFDANVPSGCTLTGKVPDDMVQRNVMETHTFTIPPMTGTVTGFTFGGWVDTSTIGVERIYIAGDDFITSGETRTWVLSAKWTPAGSGGGDSGDTPESGASPSYRNYLAASYDGNTKFMVLPLVTDIDDTVNVSITSISTVIYGVRNRFVMDMGASERFTMTLARVNPVDYDDNSSDSTMWSNGKWVGELENLFDFWQNLGRDIVTKKLTGGVRLHFEPPEEARNLYPIIDKNVFLAGNLSTGLVAPQTISVSLPLQVARMTGTSNVVSQVTAVFKSGLGSNTEMVSTYPTGSTIPLPLAKDEWSDDYPGFLFSHWESNGMTYDPGTLYTFNEDVTFTAVWSEAKKVVILAEKGSGEYTVETGITRMTVYMVGAGGNGGAGYFYNMRGYAGGAGGAGQFVRRMFQVSEGQVVSYTTGYNGAGVSKDRRATMLSVDGVMKLRAEGGDNGSSASAVSAVSSSGGRNYVKGGSTGPGFVKGEDGGYAAPNIPSNAGRGSEPLVRETALATYRYQGGAGGAAAGLRHSFIVDGVKTLYESKGGDGATYGYAMNGVLGGGGGSGSKDYLDDTGGPGTGGDGFIALLFH